MKDKPLHILVIPSWYSTNPNDAEGIFFREQIGALSQLSTQIGVFFIDLKSLRKLNVTHLSQQHFQTKIANHHNVTTYHFCGWNIPVARLRPVLYSLIGRYLFAKYIKQHGMPDVIYCLSALWAGQLGYDLFKKYQIPYVLAEHNSYFLRFRLMNWQLQRLKQIYAHAAKTIAVSRALAQALVQKDLAHEIAVIPNGTDCDFFTPPASINEKSAEKVNFLAIGRLDENKGYLQLIQAFCSAFAGREKYQLQIIGGGHLFKMLTQKIRELNMTSQIKLLGPANKEQVRQNLANAHIVVVPSQFETFSVVTIEALAMGLPVLATRCGGPEDIINETCGWFVDSNQPSVLAKGLVLASETYVNFSQNAIRARALEYFSIKAIAAQLYVVFKREAKNVEQ